MRKSIIQFTLAVSLSLSSLATTPSYAASHAPSTERQNVIDKGMRYLGTPYEFGSSRNNPRTFDCSDFVRQAYLEGTGIKLPADSRKQGAYVKKNGVYTSSWRNLKPGDIMFFMSYRGNKDSNYSRVNKNTQRITHNGIYLGNGKILHTYSKQAGGVKISTIAGTHWEKRFLFGGSVLK
ncbi:MAG: C40 family peptidase [Paenibacillus sp.]|nr:C40 family peptidase [Paenibacillus sp.]